MIQVNCQEPISFHISDISNDSDILSLFKDAESNDEPVGADIEAEPMIAEPQDLSPEPNFNERGYYSDMQTVDRKAAQPKKHKPIINKKLKNKCKKRSKLYIQILQNRISELQNENDKLKKLNKVNKQYVQRLNQSEQHINGYFVGKQQVIEKIDALLMQPEGKNSQILEELQCLRRRQGALGKDRLKAINYYFKQMLEMLLPEIQKYMLNITLSKSDFFDSGYIENGQNLNDVEGWRKKLLDSIGSASESDKVRRFLKENERRMESECKKFKDLVQSFYSMKCSLVEQARKIEQVFDGSHKYMNARQICKVLCFIDKYRFEKNITIEHTLSELFAKMRSQNYGYSADRLFQDAGENN